MDPRCRPWGEHDIALQLPALGIRLLGLSAAQAGMIQREYTGFVAPDPGPGALTCSARRVDDARWPAMEALSRGGEYAPLLTESEPGSLHIAGFDFEACCDLADSPASACLFTECESSLARPLVLENLLRILSARNALARGGLLLHSAGILADGAAWLFVGASNAGKTTLSRKARAAGHRILSDDMNLVLPAGSGWRAHAVPFTGEFGRSPGAPEGGESYPLAGLVCLARSTALAAAPARPAAAVATVIAGAPFINTFPALADQLDAAVTGLVQAVPTLALASERDTPFEAIRSALGDALPGAASAAGVKVPEMEVCDAGSN